MPLEPKKMGKYLAIKKNLIFSSDISVCVLHYSFPICHLRHIHMNIFCLGYLYKFDRTICI